MPALEKAKQVEQLADALTTCANTIHDRLIEAIDNKEVDKRQAQSTLQDEGMLRQQANSFLIDAALFTIADLEVAQSELISAIEEAEKEIARIKKIEAFLDFVADILALAAAVNAGKPKVVIAALKEVRDDLTGGALAAVATTRGTRGTRGIAKRGAKTRVKISSRSRANTR